MKVEGTLEKDITSDVPGIILLSHGPLCSGLLGSLRLINGDVENVTAFQLEEGDDPEEYRDAFVKTYECMPTKSIFMIDMFGGTPCNETLKYFLQRGTPIRALCGVNLGMLMEACVKRYQEEDYLSSLGAIGQECVINIGDKWNQQSHD